MTDDTNITAGAPSECGKLVRHGYTEFPMSRGRWCQADHSLNCGPITYEPQSVEGPKGFPRGGPRDGELASGNNTRFSVLDALQAPNGQPWPRTKVRAGHTYRAAWCMTMPHSTSQYHYYLTRDGWDSSKPLHRGQLDLEPFETIEFTAGEYPDNRFAHWLTIPYRKPGWHILYAVWDVADTANAFYSACDLTIT